MTLILKADTAMTSPGAAPIVPGFDIVTSDSFAAGSSFASRTSDAALGGTGMAYVSLSTGLTISSGVASVIGGATFFHGFNWTESADQQLTVKVTSLPVGNTLVLNVRKASAASSSTNAYRLVVNTSGTISLQKRIGSTDTTLTSATPFAVGDTIGIRVKGSTIQSLKNGVVVATATDTEITSGGYQGLSGAPSLTAGAVDDLILRAA